MPTIPETSNADLQQCRPSRTERGASLTEYALLVALVAVVLIPVLQRLSDGSEDLLDDTGSGIAAPRPYDDDVIATPVAAAPPWAATTTTPSSLLTFVEKPIRIADGNCLALSVTIVTAEPCGGANEILVTGLSDDGTSLTFAVGDGTLCLAGDAIPVPPALTLTPCAAGADLWTQEALSGLFVTYRHSATGLCLMSTPTAPPPADRLTLAACDGSPDQTIEVIY